MKILLVHSFLYPYGGDSLYTLRLGELLEAKGHEVAYWGMKNSLNIKHRYSEYELEEIDFNAMNNSKNILNGIRVLLRSIYSIKARKLVSKVVENFKPDVVHLQSIHPFLTTSIVYGIKKHKVPIVWTQHNLSLVCCNYMMSGNKICEKCKPNKFYYPVLEKCKRGSLRASIVGSLQLYFDYISGVSNKVDKFITISKYYTKKLKEFGFKESQLTHIPNFFDSNPITLSETSETSNNIIYFGRLSSEKGIEVLIDAFTMLSTDAKLLIVGGGPLKENLEKMVDEKKIKNIDFLGQLKYEELIKLLNISMFSIVPSLCYENFPNTILESFSFSKPVIGSNIGGIPEMVIDKQTGLLFNPGDSQDLSDKIDYLLKNPDFCKSLGKNASRYLNDTFSSEVHYEKLLKVYSEVIKK